jgi:hypothetical protein
MAGIVGTMSSIGCKALARIYHPANSQNWRRRLGCDFTRGKFASRNFLGWVGRRRVDVGGSIAVLGPWVQKTAARGGPNGSQHAE